MKEESAKTAVDLLSKYVKRTNKGVEVLEGLDSGMPIKMLSSVGSLEALLVSIRIDPSYGESDEG